MTTILVINPNSSEDVTLSMAASLAEAGLNLPGVACVTNPEGPPGIETDAHVAQVVPALSRMLRAVDAECYVIACFSDPGIAALRQVTVRPVIGIGEAAYLAALTIGKQFGIISIVTASILRHRNRLTDLGLETHLAGDRAIDVGVGELQGGGVFARLRSVGMQLKHDGAESVILGCAGLGGYRAALQQVLELPVIDPVQAAVRQARGSSPGPRWA